MEGRLSPWAERFGFIGKDRFSILNEDGLQHSGLAIEYPKRHPKFYHDPVSEDDLKAKPRNGAEFDRLFFSEMMQRLEFGGGTTLEAASLNRHLFGIESGGHLSKDNPHLFAEAYSRRSIQVNESRWLPFLRKTHWLDLHVTRGYTPEGGPWSVDNPKIWDNLKASIELANRIFVALAANRDNGFEALLFGRLVFWKDVASLSDVAPPNDSASVLLTPEMELKIAAARNTPPWKNELAALPEKDRLRGMVINWFTKFYFWSFYTSQRSYGRTWMRKPDEWPLSLLNTRLLQHLLKNDITVSERFMLQFALASVIIHETFHGIMGVRLFNEGFYAFNSHREPFVDFDPVAEAGHAIEKGLFGGRWVLKPSYSEPLLFSLSEWPKRYSSGVKNFNHPALQDTSRGFEKPFPVLYMSRIFSSEFWDNSFGPPRTSSMYWQTDMFRNWRLNTENEKDWDRFDRAIASTWRDRKREQGIARRGWFKTHYLRWSKTPWNSLEARRDIEAFAEGFRKRDEFKCHETSLSMQERLDLTDKRVFFDSLPSISRRANFWAFSTIGLLMSAAMPLNSSRKLAFNPDTRLTQYDAFTFMPSKEAMIAKQNDESYEIPLVRVADLNEELKHLKKYLTREANILYNPFKPTNNPSSSKVEPEKPATQMEYLALVEQILIHIRDQEALVSSRWYREIDRCLRNIFAQRQEIMAQHPQDHTTRWVTVWPFTVPEYDPVGSNWMRWDPRDQVWNYYNDHVIESPPRRDAPVSSSSSSS
ncbi:hypothetical protein F5Y03DRAFT_404185 [Xylaria venustula]|nr:hypothetical protein F5Y03DRAFT_404185 [Xylaria venustula]